MAANTNTNANTNANARASKSAEEAAEQATDQATKQFEENAQRVKDQVEENTERMKEFNSAVLDSSKAGSRMAIDNYERAAKSFFEMQRQLVSASRVEWVKQTSNTQIQFAEEVTNAWVKAARDLLK